MPIKFRCQHCRQFLGISRGKAGMIVDCPTCGRTIRVPELDGTIKPLPKPGLNTKDSELARALDELASIGESEAPPESKIPSESPAAPEPRRKPVLRSVEIAPLPAPVPIEVSAPPPPPPPPQHVSSTPEEGRPWASTAAPGEAWRRLIAAANDGSSDASSEDQAGTRDEVALVPAAQIAAAFASQTAGENEEPVPLTELASELVPAEPSPQTASVRGSFHWTPRLSLIFSGILALVFAVGFWAGRVTSTPAVPAAQPMSQANSARPDPFAAADVSSERTPSIRGRITYVTGSGERRPDRGARLLVLPAQRAGSTRITPVGLRPDAPSEDRQVAVTAIRTAGGDFAVTDDEGRFEIALSGAGQYHILVLSNSLSRDDAQTGAVDAVLSPFFERPAQIYGRVRFHLESIRHSGDGVTPWDHSFAP
jgi:hypothetical protein